MSAREEGLAAWLSEVFDLTSAQREAVSMLDAHEPLACLAGGVTTRADVAPLRALDAVAARAQAHPGGLGGVLADDAVGTARAKAGIPDDGKMPRGWHRRCGG